MTDSCKQLLNSVYVVLGVHSVQCKLTIMAWRDWEELHNFVYCDNGRVGYMNSRGGWRWEWYRGYNWIWETRGMTCHIGFRSPHVGVLALWIWSHICLIWIAKLTCPTTFLKLQFLMMISPIFSHLTISHPHRCYHLRTWSYVMPHYHCVSCSHVETNYTICQVLCLRSKAYTEYKIHWQ